MTTINKKKIEEFIRVDHAGERGAVKIYEGQLLALNTLVKDEDLKNGSNLLSKEDILRQLQEKNVSCKDVTFKILGLSLTSYNIIISILIVYFTTKTYLSYDNNK